MLGRESFMMFQTPQLLAVSKSQWMANPKESALIKVYTKQLCFQQMASSGSSGNPATGY